MTEVLRMMNVTEYSVNPRPWCDLEFADGEHFTVICRSGRC